MAYGYTNPFWTDEKWEGQQRLIAAIPSRAVSDQIEFIHVEHWNHTVPATVRIFAMTRQGYFVTLRRLDYGIGTQRIDYKIAATHAYCQQVIGQEIKFYSRRERKGFYLMVHHTNLPKALRGLEFTHIDKWYKIRKER